MENNATYLANRQDAETGRSVYEAVNREFEHGYELNEALLMRILRENSDTEYGRQALPILSDSYQIIFASKLSYGCWHGYRHGGDAPQDERRH